MAKHEYYAVQGKTLGNIAETMKTVLGVDKDTPIRFDEITNNEKAEQVTESIDAQTEVIEQIKIALNGKSSIGAKEIIDIIDQSGVLDSTDGTATEKVEQLIDKVSRLNWLKKETRTIGFRNNENITTLTLDCNNITHLYWFCYQTPNVESVHLTNTQNIKEWMHAFHTCPKLKTIETLDFSSVTTTLGWNHFKDISEVEVFKVAPKTLKVSANFSFSSKLINESIQSIIDGLATVGTAQTLTLHADVKAKLTEEQLAAITNKNWNLA